MKKLIFIFCTLLLLCSCSSLSRGNITGLLSSPKHSQTENEIAQEISGYLGENITLKYSQSQGYSAPIQFIDIDNDDNDEALVFYYAPNKGTNIRFALLKQTGENWDIVFDKEGLGTDVFCFDTVELQGLAGKQIIAGYLPSNISENFFVTYFTDTAAGIPDYTEVCESIVIGEVTGDGYDDVILSQKLSDGRIRLKALTFTAESGFKNVGAKTLRHSNISITQMNIAQAADGTASLYVDYADSYNKIYTEAVKIQDGAMINCLCRDYVPRSWGYAQSLNSFDIDGDKVLEIPTVIQEESSAEMPLQRFVEWSDYSQEQPVRKLWGVYDTTENIFVALPEEWQNLVYIQHSDGKWRLLQTEDNTPLVTFAQQKLNTAEDSEAKLYSINIGTDIWNIKFDESVDEAQRNLVMDNITIFS